VATVRAWTLRLAAADTSSGGLKRAFSHVHTGCRSPAGGAAGASGRAARPLLAAGAVLCARFRPARVLALLVGPGQPAPLALVHVHAPAGAKLLLLSRFERLGLFSGWRSTPGASGTYLQCSFLHVLCTNSDCCGQDVSSIRFSICECGSCSLRKCPRTVRGTCIRMH